MSKAVQKLRQKPLNKWVIIIGLPLFVLATFFAVQYGLAFALILMIGNQVKTLADNALFNTILMAVAEIIVLAIVIGLPYYLLKAKTSLKELGVHRPPSWTDILLSPAGLIVYFVLAALLTAVASLFLPNSIMQQAQDVGFKNLTHQADYVLAFLSLVVIAPVVEETIFRGFLFGKLKKHMPVIVAALVTSAVFGIAHGQINVGLNVFALSMVACYLREFTDSIWAGVLLHMIKNGIAFYFLFINPSLLHMVG
ncbi:CPBP family intramembrane metalloprotease [Candidatus Saccharibacteria bacterium]|nr:CPBP family intramembrane metalloprotease [Candidatus Saccharibacteria bacterium]